MSNTFASFIVQALVLGTGMGLIAGATGLAESPVAFGLGWGVGNLGANLAIAAWRAR